MAVVAALELDDLLAAGGGAGQADSAHRGFGAGAHKPDALDRRHQRPNPLAELDLQFGRRPETGSVLGHGGQNSEQPARCVAVDERPPRHDVVDVVIAVDILDIGAATTADEERRGADRLERTNRAVDATGQDLLCP